MTYINHNSYHRLALGLLGGLRHLTELEAECCPCKLPKYPEGSYASQISDTADLHTQTQRHTDTHTHKAWINRPVDPGFIFRTGDILHHIFLTWCLAPPSNSTCWYLFRSVYSETHANKQTNKQSINQTNKQSINQTNKQTNYVRPNVGIV